MFDLQNLSRLFAVRFDITLYSFHSFRATSGAREREYIKIHCGQTVRVSQTRDRGAVSVGGWVKTLPQRYGDSRTANTATQESRQRFGHAQSNLIQFTRDILRRKSQHSLVRGSSPEPPTSKHPRCQFLPPRTRRSLIKGRRRGSETRKQSFGT